MNPMFGGSKKAVRSLTAAVERLQADLHAVRAEVQASEEAIVDRLTAALAATPEERTEALLAAVSNDLERSLREQIERARQLAEVSGELEALASSVESGLRPPRQRLPLGVVHRATSHGYVSLFAEGGLTDKVQLLVGENDPPTEVVTSLNTRNGINSYGGGVVRPGEHWLATTLHGPDRSSVTCVYTPFR